jgi:hypothetical protein
VAKVALGVQTISAIAAQHFVKAAGTTEDLITAESGEASARGTSRDVAPSSDGKSSSSGIATSNDAVRDDAKPCETEAMGDTGLEHIQKSPEKLVIASQGAAESGAVLPSERAELPAELMEIIVGWSHLPVVVQAAILAIIRTPL